MNFIAIDFETANAHRSSPCSLGVCVVENSRIIEEKEWLIRPPRNHYNVKNIEIHGITPEMTADQPEFHELWDEIKPYIHNQILLAHNGNNIEKNVIIKTLHHYGIPYSEKDFNMVDTANLCKILFSFTKGSKLTDYCNLLSIPFDKALHHNSLYDAKKTAELGIKLYEHFNLLPDFTINHSKISRQIVNNNQQKLKLVNYEDIDKRKISSELKVPKIDLEDTSHFFYKKKVVITGTFLKFPIREEMARLLYNVGADINVSISKRTDYVIVGSSAGPKKLQQIEDFNIQTISEEQFLEIFNL